MTKEAILACEYPFISRFLDSTTRKAIQELVKEGKMVRLDLQNPKRIRYERPEAAAERDTFRTLVAAEREAEQAAEAAKHLPTETTCLVQYLDPHSSRWFNQGFPHPDKDFATDRLLDLRATYPDRTFRLMQIATVKTVIA